MKSSRALLFINGCVFLFLCSINTHLVGTNGKNSCHLSPPSDVAGNEFLNFRDDPLLQTAPSKEEFAHFDQLYEIRTYENPDRFVPVMGMMGYVKDPEETAGQIFRVASRVMRDIDNVLRSDQRKAILTPILDRELIKEVHSAVFKEPGSVELALKIFNDLPKKEKDFFTQFIRTYLPQEAANPLIHFLKGTDRKVQTPEKYRLIALGTKFFLTAVFYYKAPILALVRERFSQYQSYLSHYEENGVWIDTTILFAFEDAAHLSGGKFQPWLKTVEAKGFIRTLRSLNSSLHIQELQPNDWVRDQRAYLTPEQETVITAREREKTDSILSFMLGDRDIRKTLITDGGAVIAGEGQSQFLLISEEIPVLERQVLAWKLKERGIRIYSLPGGFLTFRLKEKNYFVGFSHLDLTINVVSSEFTKDDRSKLLIDPFYYSIVKDLPEFKRLIKEQGFQPEDLVVIDQQDRELHLANFTLIFDDKGEKRLIFNGPSTTIGRIGLKEDTYREVPLPMHLALRGGSLRCATQLFPKEEVQERVYIDLQVKRFDDEQAQSIAQCISSRHIEDIEFFTRAWLKALHIRPFPGDDVHLMWEALPGKAVLFLPRKARPEELPGLIEQGFQELKERLTELWDGQIPLDSQKSPIDTLSTETQTRFSNAIKNLILESLKGMSYEDFVKKSTNILAEYLPGNKPLFDNLESLQALAVSIMKTLDKYEENPPSYFETPPRFVEFYNLFRELVERGNLENFYQDLTAHLKKYSARSPAAKAQASAIKVTPEIEQLQKELQNQLPRIVQLSLDMDLVSRWHQWAQEGAEKELRESVEQLIKQHQASLFPAQAEALRNKALGLLPSKEKTPSLLELAL